MKKVAGTVMLFNTQGEPRFLIDHRPCNCFVTAEKESEEMTNLGAILLKLKRLHINTSELQLVDLVDVSDKGQHHTPLFVFAIGVQAQPTIEEMGSYEWTDTATFQKLLGNVTLEDVAGINY